MSFLLKDTIHTALVDALYSEITSRRSNYFYYIGKVMEWPDPDVPGTPLATGAYEKETRNQIIATKKIQSTDVSYVVPRINWSSGTVYDQFDLDYSSTFASSTNATSLKTARFYVLTSSFNVYKCLFNKNGAQSTSQPTGTDPFPVTTADGYVWKYLYTIPLSLRNRFLTEDYMPVQLAVQNAFYSNGEVSSVVIDNLGSGYLGNAEVTLSVDGTFKGGTGNTAAILSPVFNTSGSLVDVIIRNRGNNYSSANVAVVDNLGSGSSYYKSLKTATIFNGGSGYSNVAITSNTKATISTSGIFQPNSNAVVTLSYLNNSIIGVNIVSPGNGYTQNAISNTTLSISTSGVFQPTANATGNLTFNSTALLTPILFNGQINEVIINDPGIGYSSNVQTTLVLTGDGSGASLVPYINSAGQLEDVIIGSRGEGYTYLDIEVVGDGTGANAYAELSTGDLNTNQATVELSAIDGAIYNIKFANVGTGYSNANISVTGDGTGFEGTVIISNANTISYVTVTNPGSGYTYANVIITGSGANARGNAIFSPQGGHGSNAVKELFADTLMFYSTINNEKIHGINVNNDYRQFGLIKNIKQFANSKTFSNVTGTSCYLLTTDTVTNSVSNTLIKDTILQLKTDTTRAFEVVEVLASNTQVLITNLNNYSLADGDVLYDANTDSNFTIETIDRYPTINKFTGDLIFIDNRTQVSYSDEQLVTLRTTIRL